MSKFTIIPHTHFLHLRTKCEDVTLEEGAGKRKTCGVGRLGFLGASHPLLFGLKQNASLHKFLLAHQLKCSKAGS